jgi:hypothetical protein
MPYNRFGIKRQNLAWQLQLSSGFQFRVELSYRSKTEIDPRCHNFAILRKPRSAPGFAKKRAAQTL